MKRILALLLATVMLFSLLSTAAFAEDGQLSEESEPAEEATEIIEESPAEEPEPIEEEPAEEPRAVRGRARRGARAVRGYCFARR